MIKGGKTEESYDKYPENPARNKSVGEIGEGKMSIKGEQGATKKR